MSDSAHADFNAEVTLTTRDVEDAIPTRVLVNEDQLVLTTDDVTESVALPDIFDIAQDVPAGAGPDTTATMTIGFHRGESRELATIECRADKLSTFQFVLFKLVLGETPVTVKQTADDPSVSQDVTRAALTIHSGRFQFELDGGAFSLPRDEVERFETTTTAFGDKSQRPTVVLYSQQGEHAVKTVVCLQSFRHMNLLGRFLQTSPDAGVESATDSTPDTADILLVDDEPGDLEVTEMMLTELTDRFRVTTATSAAGGMEAIRDDPFDCVVSDYDMPGTDGIEFLRQVRADHPDLPFVLFTGQGNETVAKQAILSDVTDYVEKGIGTQQYEILATRIKKALR